jgi:multisubunit Na+/H+ antiporter MnhC subunit
VVPTISIMVVTKINEKQMILTTIVVLFCSEVLAIVIASRRKVAKEERKESYKFVKDLEKDLV